MSELLEEVHQKKKRYLKTIVIFQKHFNFDIIEVH